MKYLKYLIVFIFVFFVYYYINCNMMYLDPLNNYAFSYGILRGEIPYLDFNTISTPLYAFFMVPFLAISNHLITFMIANSLIVTIMFILLDKMYSKNSLLMIMGFFIFCFFGILPTYNLFCIFILIIILFLEEKYNDKDILIGIFIGLSILSKHTIGCFFIIPSIIFYFKNRKKLFKRFIGFIIPICIFLIYLISTGSLYKFIDLCFFGLFDFSKSNGSFASIYFVASIIMLIISIVVNIKDKKIVNLYLLFTISIVIPLFDLCHFALYFGCFCILVFKYIKIRDYFYYLFSILPVVGLSITYVYIYSSLDCSTFNLKHLNNSIICNKPNDYIFDYFDSYSDPIILSYWKVKYDISRNRNIDNFEVFLNGNYGYNGNIKLINYIDSLHDKYILIDYFNYSDDRSDNQFNKEVCDYIMNNYEYVGKENGFVVYYKK